MSLRTETVITNGPTGDTEKLRGEAAGSEPGSDSSPPEDTGEQPSWVVAMKGSGLAGSLHTQEGPSFTGTQSA